MLITVVIGRRLSRVSGAPHFRAGSVFAPRSGFHNYSKSSIRFPLRSCSWFLLPSCREQDVAEAGATWIEVDSIMITAPSIRAARDRNYCPLATPAAVERYAIPGMNGIG